MTNNGINGGESNECKACDRILTAVYSVYGVVSKADADHVCPKHPAYCAEHDREQRLCDHSRSR